MRRFSVVQEPTGTWSVFDAIFDLPAEVDGQLLIGLTRDGAIRAAAKANASMLPRRPGAGPALEAANDCGLATEHPWTRSKAGSA
jgi:hypothetical protein